MRLVRHLDRLDPVLHPGVFQTALNRPESRDRQGGCSINSRSTTLLSLVHAATGVAVVILGTVAYFSHWDTVPGGYTVDALSNVLNALCIQHTGGDEYGRFLPTDIRAFDDYRPPLLIYLLALTGFIHPLTVESARLVGMCLGWAALGLLFLLRSHFPLPPIKWGLFYPLLFTLLLCSPWVLVPHRMPVEFVTTLPVILLLLLTSWKWIQRPQSHSAAALAAVATGLLLYAYYGTKPLAFTHVLLLGAMQLRQQRRLQRSALTYLAIWSLLATPTLLDMFGDQDTLARFDAVGSVDPMHWLWAFLLHISPDFLFLTGDGNPRHHTGYGGMLNIALLPLFLAGSIALLQQVFRRRDPFWIFLALFAITCLIPVSLTRENLPHALRTLPAVLPLTLVFILGFSDLERRLAQWQRTARVALTACLLLGGWHSYQSVLRLQEVDENTDRSIWFYYPDEYVLPATYVSPANHLTISVDERYERLALQGDRLYCCGEAAEQALMATIAATDAAERDVPGSLAHEHRKFYAIALARSGQHREALERIRGFYGGQAVVEPDANDIHVHWEWQNATYVLAESASARGDHAEARQFYEESLFALQRLATWVQSHRLQRRFAVLYDRLGDHQRSLSCYLNSFGPEQDPVDGMVDIGDRYVRQGRPEVGALAYQTILEQTASMTAQQYTTLGTRLYGVGNRSVSSRAYRLALGVDASFADAHAYLGWNLIVEGRDSEAILHLERARAQQASPGGMFNLGFSYLRSGQIDTARTVYRQAVDLFGIDSGLEAQAPENLRLLIREDIQADVAREILLQYWD